MSFSAVDVARHEFSKGLRGYDPAEVRAFLERIADEVSDLQKQVAELGEQNRALTVKISAFQNMEQSMRESLMASQENLRKLDEQKEIERQNILNEARLVAEEIKLNAERELMGLHEEIRGLKIHRDAYVKRLRFLLRSQNELLDIIEQDSPEEPLKDLMKEQNNSPYHT